LAIQEMRTRASGTSANHPRSFCASFQLGRAPINVTSFLSLKKCLALAK
jgi:hypothetical protein